jgi:hypothetical protein
MTCLRVYVDKADRGGRRKCTGLQRRRTPRLPNLLPGSQTGGRQPGSQTRAWAAPPRSGTGSATSLPPSSATVGVLLEEPGERWAAVAGDALGEAGLGEPDRLLGQEHDRLLALLRRCAATRNATATRSWSSRPVARLMTTLPPSAIGYPLRRGFVRLHGRASRSELLGLAARVFELGAGVGVDELAGLDPLEAVTL